MSHLFTPFAIKDIALRNRIVMPPMCMYSSDDSGRATEWHSFHYRTRAQGGAGLIIQEATAVERRGRISARDLGIWDDSHIPALAEIAKGIKAEGAVAGIQMAHAGRKCEVSGEDVIAPSPISFDPDEPSYANPREMDEKDMETVAESFKNAAERAADAGYRFLEIHGAHGYLISEFLSPLVNKREDLYGGSEENRTRFLRMIIKSVRSVWKEEHPLALRVSAEDYHAGGNRPENLAGLINLVKDEGIDIVHVSTGGVVPHVHIPAKPGFQIPAASLIREETGLPVIGGGLISDRRQAEEIISSGRSDLVFLGRELLRNPSFPLLSARESGIEIPYIPEQYKRAF